MRYDLRNLPVKDAPDDWRPNKATKAPDPDPLAAVLGQQRTPDLGIRPPATSSLREPTADEMVRAGLPDASALPMNGLPPSVAAAVEAARSPVNTAPTTGLAPLAPEQTTMTPAIGPPPETVAPGGPVDYGETDPNLPTLQRVTPVVPDHLRPEADDGQRKRQRLADMVALASLVPAAVGAFAPSSGIGSVLMGLGQGVGEGAAGLGAEAQAAMAQRAADYNSVFTDAAETNQEIGIREDQLRQHYGETRRQEGREDQQADRARVDTALDAEVEAAQSAGDPQAITAALLARHPTMDPETVALYAARQAVERRAAARGLVLDQQKAAAEVDRVRAQISTERARATAQQASARASDAAAAERRARGRLADRTDPNIRSTRAASRSGDRDADAAREQMSDYRALMGLRGKVNAESGYIEQSDYDEAERQYLAKWGAPPRSPQEAGGGQNGFASMLGVGSVSPEIASRLRRRLADGHISQDTYDQTMLLAAEDNAARQAYRTGGPRAAADLLDARVRTGVLSQEEASSIAQSLR